MQYTLYVEPTRGDVIREYNGQPIDYRSVSELPQWMGRYDEIEFLLLSMLGDGGWAYEDEVYSRDYATNFVSVRMEFWEDELPGFIFYTHDGRVAPVQFNGLFYPPFKRVADFIDYLGVVQSAMHSPSKVYVYQQTARPAESYTIGPNSRYIVGTIRQEGY